MYSLNGAGDGAQYAVTSYSDGSESTWEKIYIYIGDDNNTEDLNSLIKMLTEMRSTTVLQCTIMAG